MGVYKVRKVFLLRFLPANFRVSLSSPEDDTLKKKILFHSGTKSLLEWLLSETQWDDLIDGSKKAKCQQWDLGWDT